VRRDLIEAMTGRRVRLDSGEDGRDGLVVFHYKDEPATLRTMTREACFLCGNYIADYGEPGGTQESGLPGSTV
jgi:hypothetical protein